MAKKHRRVTGSAAHAALSKEAKSLLGALYGIAESVGRDKNNPILVEVEPARLVEVRLSESWRKFGDAAPGHIERARRLVDLAQAAFEADCATKQ